MTTLIDKYNRHLNYLRISVTDRCNLRCIYCMPRNFVPKLHHDEILRYEEILRLVRLGVNLGISKIRITGGEPLVRKGICEFMAELSRITGLSDVSLTTNGIFLKDYLRDIRAAGITRINVSLDTLSRSRFEEITGYDGFDRVWEGICLAHEIGFHPIKINVVAIRGINDDELRDIAKLSFSYPFHIRFIEYMPIGEIRNPKSEIRDEIRNLKLGTPNLKSDDQVKCEILGSEIMEHIRPLGRLIPVDNEIYDGPADRYRFEGAKGEIGIIHPLSRHFCYKCNRLRLTASGQLRACLLSDREEDLKGPLRSGCSDGELAEIFLKAVRVKPFRHNVTLGQESVQVSSQMSGIGG